MEPSEVPRENENIGPEDEDEIYSLRKPETPSSSRTLEEVLGGLILKFAKEKFRSRITESPEVSNNGLDQSQENSQVFAKVDAREAGISRHSSQDSYPQAHRNLKEQSPGEGLNATWFSHGSAQGEGILIPDEVEKQDFWLAPVIATDDDRSQDILQPSIRRTLDQLDEVLLTLHNTRKLCLQYAARSDPETDNENNETSVLHDQLSPDVPATEEKKPVGRPRKDENILSRENSQGIIDITGGNDPSLWRQKKTNIGRPRKKYERLEGETEHEYLVRVARLQKKPLPKFTSVEHIQTSEVEDRSPKMLSRKPSRQPSPERPRFRQKRLRPRDWSEVIGSASLTGFSEQVISRATQRCADIFGEGMRLRSLAELATTSSDADILTAYYPGKVPEINPRSSHLQEPSQLNLDDLEDTDATHSRSTEHKERGRLPLRRYSSFCPMADCERYVEGFSSDKDLRKHLEELHDMRIDQLENLLLDSDEDGMDGAVHRDGYMRPVNAQRGWRGRDQRPRKPRADIRKENNGGIKVEISDSE